MITQIEINEYRCFRSLRVPLGNFNVLVGPNNTGKSNFLKTLASIPYFGTRPAIQEDYYRFDDRNKPSVSVRANNQKVTIAKTKAARAKSPSENEIISTILPIRYFDVPKLVLPMQSAGTKSSTPISEIVVDNGNNVAALLDYMLRKERDLFFRFVKSLKAMIPGLEDIGIDTPTPESRLVNLVLDDGLEMRAGLASMGVRLMIFFATFAFHPLPPKLILIEEPETGVHPKRLADIVNLLRSISTGGMGQRPAQIVLTTHSPYLLDCVNLKTDNVLVFEREPDGARTAKPVNKERLNKYMDDFMLGEFWFNGGEDVLTNSNEDMTE